MLIFDNAYGYKLEDAYTKPVNYFLRCPGLFKAMTQYSKDFPWIVSELHVRPIEVVSFVINNLDSNNNANIDKSDYIANEFVGELYLLLDELSAPVSDSEGSSTLCDERFLRIQRDLASSASFDLHIKNIEAVVSSVYDSIKTNDVIDEENVRPVALKGDYMVVSCQV